jgi:hypothetical protein
VLVLARMDDTPAWSEDPGRGARKAGRSKRPPRKPD